MMCTIDFKLPILLFAVSSLTSPRSTKQGVSRGFLSLSGFNKAKAQHVCSSSFNIVLPGLY